MEDRETKMLKEAYMVVLKEFEDYGDDDDGAENDSWWWEEGRGGVNNQGQTPIETDYSVASQQHKALSPETTQRPFNSYEQCNKLILSCDSRREIIQHFCNIINELTADDQESQQALVEFVRNIEEQNNLN